MTGVLRVEAESEEEAQRMALEAPVRMAGTKVFGLDVAAETVGEVERHTLAPDNVRQRTGLDDG